MKMFTGFVLGASITLNIVFAIDIIALTKACKKLEVKDAK